MCIYGGGGGGEWVRLVGGMTENGAGEALRCKMEGIGTYEEHNGKAILVIYETDTTRQSRSIWIN